MGYPSHASNYFKSHIKIYKTLYIKLREHKLISKHESNIYICIDKLTLILENYKISPINKKDKKYFHF